VGVFIGFNGRSQNMAEIDKENGFKEYTIGSKLESLEKKIKLIDENGQTKLYKAKEKAKINGMSGEIELAFYKDRLVEITIVFKRRSQEEYDSLKHSFERQFGHPKDQSLSKKKPAYLSAYDKIFTWEGFVIGLQFNYDVSHKSIEIVYWGLKEKTQKSREKF